MKTCPGCKQAKDFSEFGKNSGRSDGLQTECKECKKVRMKDYYSRNRESFRSRNLIALEDARLVIRKLKDVPCMDCGVKYPYYVMDFDHRDPEMKIGNISKMATYGKKKFLDEIAKCDVVCSNCHRERTHNHAPLV